VHPLSNRLVRDPSRPGMRLECTSTQTGNTYRCFLPDLTGFISVCCVVSNLLQGLARSTQHKPFKGNSIPLSGFRVTGHR
jgi:hypothetical protein